MTLEIFVNLSAEAVFGIATSSGIQRLVPRNILGVQFLPFRSTSIPSGGMSDVLGRFPLGLGSGLLTEYCGLSGPHDSAESPGVGSVERPVLAQELPSLCCGVLG